MGRAEAEAYVHSAPSELPGCLSGTVTRWTTAPSSHSFLDEVDKRADLRDYKASLADFRAIDKRTGYTPNSLSSIYDDSGNRHAQLEKPLRARIRVKEASIRAIENENREIDSQGRFEVTGSCIREEGVVSRLGVALALELLPLFLIPLFVWSVVRLSRWALLGFHSASYYDPPSYVAPASIGMTTSGFSDRRFAGLSPREVQGITCMRRERHAFTRAWRPVGFCKPIQIVS